MSLTRNDVSWVAHLARIEMNDATIDQMTEQLGRVLDYMEKLNQLDTTDVEPLSHPGVLSNVLREDEPGVSLSPDEALKNAPDRREGFFRVPRVIE